MTAPCTERTAALFDLLDDRLSSTESEALRAHLVACAGCREEYDAMAGVRSVLMRIPREAVPTSLELSVLTAIRRERDAVSAVVPPRRLGSRVRLLRAAAVLLAGLAGATVVYDGYIRPRFLSPPQHREDARYEPSTDARESPATAPALAPRAASGGPPLAPRVGRGRPQSAAGSRAIPSTEAGELEDEPGSVVARETVSERVRPAETTALASLVDPGQRIYDAALRRKVVGGRDWSALDDDVLTARGFDRFLEASGQSSASAADLGITADVVVVTGPSITRDAADVLGRFPVERWDLAAPTVETGPTYRLSLVRTTVASALLGALEDMPEALVQVFRHGEAGGPPSVFLLLLVDR